MTFSVNLTPDQDERLSREAQGRGLPADALFRQLLDQVLSQIGTTRQHPKERVLGLHAGQTWIADDFDAPLPDSFWLGEE